MLPTYPPSDGPLDAALQAWHQGQASTGTFTQKIQLRRPWQTPAAVIDLTAQYRFKRKGGKVAIHAGFDGLMLPLDQPLELQPITVGKPWGQEIWYTAMEARGESGVRTGQEQVPLSSYLALAPERLCRNRPIVLLKILDPKPEPVLGDLYFEVHDHKREVYVVTAIDQTAWPDGSGEIRFGMNQHRRADFADDDAFRGAYLQAVKDYEFLRRAADAGTAVDPVLEADKRRAMEAFTSIRAVAVGDVVAVPTWVPHSLQHGVRVVEFQTPSYERFIVSFAQRVLTQDHWDSDHAIANMSLDLPPEPTFAELTPGIEQIVDFEDFSVWRVVLGAGEACEPPLSVPYAVCMNVSGGVAVHQHHLAPERACFVPNTALPLALRNSSQQMSVSLIAAATW